MKHRLGNRWLLALFVMLIVGLVTSCADGDNDAIEPPPEQPEQPGDDSAETEQTAEELAVQARLDELSLEEKIGQLLIVGLEGTTVSDEDRRKLTTDHVGGFVFFKRNLDTVEQTIALIDELNAINPGPPLLFSIDEEGGAVSRLPAPLHTLPAARTIAAEVTPDMAEKLSQANGDLLSSLGFNMNFAPVLDVDSHPQNPVIGDRAYGATPEVVIEYGKQTLIGLKRAGVIPVVKHFPGHGDTELDSHIGLPVIDHSLERLERVEFAPFRQLSDQVDVMMVGHLVISAFDSSLPATLSREMVTGILREQWGYDGVVITDDLTMGAIMEHHEIDEAILQAVQAGVDLLLIAHDDELQHQAVTALRDAVEAGDITEERIDESVYRVLRLKHQYELESMAPSHELVDEQNEQLAELLASF